MRHRLPKRGYAMVIVLVFIALLLCFYGVAYRHVGAALRAESVRIVRQARDEGVIHALARGLTLLETGTPPMDPYVCATLIGPPGQETSYTVTFASTDVNVWSIGAASTEWPDTPPPMPTSLAE